MIIWGKVGGIEMLYINEIVVVIVYLGGVGRSREGREGGWIVILIRMLVLEFVMIITIIDNKIY